MNIQVKLIYFAVDLLVPLIVGYLFRNKPWPDGNFFDNMANCNMLLLYPFLSILSFWVLPFRWELAWLPAFGVILCFIPGLIAYLISRNKYNNPLDNGSYIIAAILSNIGTLGGLCTFILYGETGFAYTQLVAVLQAAVIFLVCYPLADYYRRSGQGADMGRVPLAKLFFSRNQLPVLGLVIGFLLYYFHVPRPAILGEIFDPLVHIAAWTALIPVGYSLDFSAIQKYYVSTLDLVPVKFVFTPLIAYVIAQQVFSDQKIIHAVVILASMPTAISAVIIAKLHGLNVHITNASFILTTALFLLVIYPLLFFLLQ
ncbi:AEC family transporter [Sporomusa acidovorans]|uniref:Membrane transport protein n=1 Tax=Sporomusa acidovorans (strain ATCC 49682 / DSM 3132 / Mol) TaxID=1123286 RepID=A0ABZ3J1P2_SPOA4|nr:AEC family transporter [Sporomusa acidovorans]OZC23217.1 membrane transport protein [Sporomusa acidovorans DSM 3132]SDE97932.1 hypothetical protein SAMN04488499_102852 [Sporomusa acidovorans]